ncbi:MAG: flavin reductase family protein [Planctomycetes bacterium]|nr:flavin reductase family protein [Planctomycetota bacterium]
MDLEAKKSALRSMPHGLYVVTLRRGEERCAFTATWVTQTSFEPPLLAMAVRADSYARSFCQPGAALALHWLDKQQKSFAQTFFKAPPVEGRSFGPYTFQDGAHGAPILDGVLAHVEGLVHSVVEVGDHHPVLFEVVDAKIHRLGDALVLADTGWKYGG